MFDTPHLDTPRLDALIARVESQASQAQNMDSVRSAVLTYFAAHFREIRVQPAMHEHAMIEACYEFAKVRRPVTVPTIAGSVRPISRRQEDTQAWIGAYADVLTWIDEAEQLPSARYPYPRTTALIARLEDAAAACSIADEQTVFRCCADMLRRARGEANDGATLRAFCSQIDAVVDALVLHDERARASVYSIVREWARL